MDVGANRNQQCCQSVEAQLSYFALGGHGQHIRKSSHNWETEMLSKHQTFPRSKSIEGFLFAFVACYTYVGMCVRHMYGSLRLVEDRSNI